MDNYTTKEKIFNIDKKKKKKMKELEVGRKWGIILARQRNKRWNAGRLSAAAFV